MTQKSYCIDESERVSTKNQYFSVYHMCLVIIWTLNGVYLFENYLVIALQISDVEK